VAYEYGAKEPEKLKIKDMTPKQEELLIKSDNFCMLPWMHLHAYPDGRAYPCCFAFDPYPVGDLNKNSMKEVFNGEKMKAMRLNMLNNKPSKECGKCYEQERAGFFSLRLSSNKHFGHNIDLVDSTQADGTADFIIKYWDIRFSNLCNMACRSCGTWFSSNWYEDHKKLTGSPPPHAKIMRVGRSSDDMWEQMLSQFDHVEQFYFAGGEPLIMEEHYRILKELDRRKMYHVRLIYNTNFSKLTFKDMDVLELWNKFDSVSVGASLDAEGARAELMRKGTVWEDAIKNRRRMMEISPKTDFYISATVGLINAFHVPDFHRSWIEQGLIKPQDFNFNLLQYPIWQRMDIFPKEFKIKVEEKYNQHIEWLKTRDPLTRATKGFQSAINWMNAKDNESKLSLFWENTLRYDEIRNEKTLGVFPELQELYEYYEKNKTK
jgi:radical SAM protein with 4Fe4S-binding SPASM domain